MPFITEEMWQLLIERKNGESIMVSLMPEAKKYNKDLITDFESVKETVSAVRTVRKEKGIPGRDKFELQIRADRDSWNVHFLPVLVKMCNLTHISFVSEKQAGTVSFMVGTTEYFIPLGGSLDFESELDKAA